MADSHPPGIRYTEAGRTALTIASEAVERIASRRLERLQRSGLWRHKLDFERDRVVLLFFEDFDRDRILPGDRHAVRVVRRLVQAARSRQKVTGFGVAFASLKRALESAGYVVREQDFELARANPHYPIGIAGYPHVLDRWRLPNPAVLGPGLLDHPRQRPDLMNDPRFARYIVPCDWMRALFGTTYPDDKLGTFFAGIDTTAWTDLAGEPKDLDFIVYEKFLWDRKPVAEQLLSPILSTLSARGLEFEKIVYRHYDHATYKSLLRRARGLIFLCEHETQGLAYQEAMASNVPVLAWDCEQWCDPGRLRFGEERVPASSVPFFDARCGERFRGAAEFPRALDRFLANRARYQPRAYVLENLSLERSAQAYLKLYREAAAQAR